MQETPITVYIVGSAPIKVGCTSVVPTSCRRQRGNELYLPYAVQSDKVAVQIGIFSSAGSLSSSSHAKSESSKFRCIIITRICWHFHRRILFNCESHIYPTFRSVLKDIIEETGKRAFLFNLAYRVTACNRWPSLKLFSPPGEPQEDHEVHLFCQHLDTLLQQVLLGGETSCRPRSWRRRHGKAVYFSAWSNKTTKFYTHITSTTEKSVSRQLSLRSSWNLFCSRLLLMRTTRSIKHLGELTTMTK